MAAPRSLKSTVYYSDYGREIRSIQPRRGHLRFFKNPTLRFLGIILSRRFSPPLDFVAVFGQNLPVALPFFLSWGGFLLPAPAFRLRPPGFALPPAEKKNYILPTRPPKSLLLPDPPAPAFRPSGSGLLALGYPLPIKGKLPPADSAAEVPDLRPSGSGPPAPGYPLAD